MRFPWMRAATGGLLVLLAGGCGAPPIEVVTPHRGPIEAGFVEPARTRLVRTYPVSMPVTARVAALTLREGDAVRAGQPLASIDTTELEAAVHELEASREELRAELTRVADHRLEDRLKKGAQDEVVASEQALAASKAQVEAERLRFEQYERDNTRDEKLFEQKAITRQQLDQTHLDYQTSRIDYRRQGFYTAALAALHTAIEIGPEAIDDWLERREHEAASLRHRVTQVEAQLVRARYQLGLAALPAPIDGVVLEKHHQGGVVLGVGTPLYTLGRLDQVEVVAEVLSGDALLLASGSRVVLEGDLPARVTRLEPQGFTKHSSLGVEQQRVLVRIAPDGSLPAGVGPGYRLEARFVAAAKADALLLPRHAVLQDRDRSHYVLVVEGGRLRRKAVTLGLASDLEVEVTHGLGVEDQVVHHPDVSLNDGDRAQAQLPPR